MNQAAETKQVYLYRVGIYLRSDVRKALSGNHDRRLRRRVLRRRFRREVVRCGYPMWPGMVTHALGKRRLGKALLGWGLGRLIRWGGVLNAWWLYRIYDPQTYFQPLLNLNRRYVQTQAKWRAYREACANVATTT